MEKLSAYVFGKKLLTENIFTVIEIFTAIEKVFTAIEKFSRIEKIFTAMEKISANNFSQKY